MTSPTPDPIELAIRHVTEGTERVLNQTRLVARLRAGGHDSAAAEEVLAQFRQALAHMQDHRQRFQAAYGAQ